MDEYINLRERQQIISKKGNYCFLGVAIAFAVCAYIQFRTDGLLPAWLYFTIASASLSISAFELTKDIAEAIMWFCNSSNSLIKHVDVLAKQHIELFSKSESLGHEAQELQRFLIDDKGRKTIEKNNRRLQLQNKFLNALTCLEIVFVTVMIIITPLRTIQYDEKTTKIINVITIITFSVMFFSSYINNWIEGEKAQLQALLYFEETNSSYYLNILERINSDQTK